MFILVKHVVKFYKVSMTGFEPALSFKEPVFETSVSSLVPPHGHQVALVGFEPTTK